MNVVREALDGREGVRIDRVSKARREADRSQHAQLVFRKAPLGIANRANYMSLEILATADEIQDFIVDGIEQKAVDGEVAPLDVFLRRLAEANFVRMAAIAVTDVASKCGNLNHIGFGVIRKGVIRSDG